MAGPWGVHSIQVEAQHRKDTGELVFGDFTFSEFVEVLEELFNSNSLHDKRLEHEAVVRRMNAKSARRDPHDQRPISLRTKSRS